MSVIKIGNVEIGGNRVIVAAGPCAIESEEQALTIAKSVQKSGALIFRGGAYKPRTKRSSFQGLGEKGLEILETVKRETGLLVITEVMDPRDVEKIYRFTDFFQIGSRSFQNFPLLIEVGKTNKPIMVKRGMGAKLDIYLSAVEYITAEGNEKVILCERGINALETYSKNTLDVNAIMALKTLSTFPVFGDPSHGTGRNDMVGRAAKACLVVGADGLLIEVHNNPSEALCDGDQALTLRQFDELMTELKELAQTKAIGRSI